MPNQITQKKIHIKREAKILEDKLVYKSTLLGTPSEVTVPFEELSRVKDSHTLMRMGILYITGISALCTLCTYAWKDDKGFDPLAWIFWGMLCVASGIAFLVSIENLWKVRVQNNSYLFFFKSLPNKQEVDLFLDEMLQSRDRYLRETYFFEPTRNISYETQKNDLQWLRKMNVISNQEFKSTLKQLDELFNQETKKIGFN